MEHNFGEKKKEKIKGVEYDVWQTPKYVESRNKAIELIESEQYKGVLKDGDFWVLMNKISENTIAYTGLIITHNACIKINDILPQEKKFQPNCFMYRTEEYANGLLGVYADDEIFEFGEVSPKNCKNDYPYAMVLKRCFDRVVLKKSGIAQWGIYSDSEADEFKEKYEKEEVFDAPLNNVKDLADEFRKIYTEEEQTRLLNGLHITRAEDMGTVNLEKYINFKKYGKQTAK